VSDENVTHRLGPGAAKAREPSLSARGGGRPRKTRRGPGHVPAPTVGRVGSRSGWSTCAFLTNWVSLGGTHGKPGGLTVAKQLVVVSMSANPEPDVPVVRSYCQCAVAASYSNGPV